MKLYLFILLFTLCSMHALQGDTIRKDYCFMSGEAKRQAQNEISKKFGLTVVGAGGGAITVVRLVDLDFETDAPITIPEARKLLISCSDILLKHLNGYRPLRPFLFEYPFPIQRINLAISVSREGKMKLPKDAPTIFSLYEGKIKYRRPPDNYDKPAPPGVIHSETYAEALQILAKENKDQQSPESPVTQKTAADECNAISPVTEFIRKGEAESTIPRYVGPQEERDMLWHLDKYANSIAKKYDMEFHIVGDFSDVRDETYSLFFINFHQMTLDQGKEFAHTLVKDFLRELKTSPTVRKYHEYCNKRYKEMRYPPLITEEPVPEQMGLKIGFWDKNFDRPKKPYLAEIVFLNGAFHYYEANPETQALQLVLKENLVQTTSTQEKSSNE